MKATEHEMEALRAICPAATPMSEGGNEYVYLPGLRIPVDDEVLQRDALLGLTPAGYGVRLYLSDPIPRRQSIGGNPANWSSPTILGRAWHTWSWRGVPREQPAIRCLAELLSVLR